MGTPATRWEYRYMVFGLLNSHTLLVSKLDTVRPVRYEMKGYDSLMASYYDNYVVEYISFEDWEPDLEKFELPKGTRWQLKLAKLLMKWICAFANFIAIIHISFNEWILPEFNSLGPYPSSRKENKTYMHFICF